MGKLDTRTTVELAELGFSGREIGALRRIQMTLHRWAELEHGDGNDYASWAIERDDETGIPYRCFYPHRGGSVPYQSRG